MLSIRISDMMVSTLENVRLREGNRVVVSLESGEYEAEILDSSNEAELKVKLDRRFELERDFLASGYTHLLKRHVDTAEGEQIWNWRIDS